MEGKDAASESGGSFADSQYDMIDDLSDVSNDDHDTASIASHDGTGGQLTPEYAQSEADSTEEHTEMLRQITAGISYPTPTPESLVTLPSTTPKPAPASPADATLLKHQMKAENDLIDSYTSEDLETPRQSTMPNAFASTYRLSQRKSADRAMQTVQSDTSTNHILFVSDRDMPVDDMDVICARAAYSMDTVDPDCTLEHTVKRPPEPPSSIQQASATVIRPGGSTSATIQHCIGAERRETNSYKLLVLDSDEEHSSFYTIGEDAKIDLKIPQLAIFHLDAFTRGMAWFDTAYTAMQSLKVPILVVRDNDLITTKQATIEYGEGDLQLMMNSKHFLGMQRADLTTAITKLVGKELPPTLSTSRISRLKGGAKKMWSSRTSEKLRLMLMLLTLTLATFALMLQVGTASHPTADLATRREALTCVLDKLALSANVTEAFNIEHLMPAPPANCTQRSFFGWGPSPCPVQAHAQQAPPNHVILSLQNGPCEPRLVSVKAYRDQERTLSVNQTYLMPGVYHIALDPSEAYGNVNFNMLAARPMMNISWSGNFGNRLLQRHTYEKASTDLSKIVSKDVAVMRHAAQGITEKVTTEIGAGLSATKNVTSQLALYVTRDIQLAANTAVSVFVKAAKAGDKTASNLGKDLVLMQKGVADFSDNLSKSFKARMKSVKANSKALLRAPLEISKQRLALSKQRLQDLKKAFQKKKPVTPEKKSLLSRFESSLAATPEHELSDKQKRGDKKHTRQAKAVAEDWAQRVYDVKERTKKQRKASGVSGEVR